MDERDNSDKSALGAQAVVEIAGDVVPLVAGKAAGRIIAPLQAVGTVITEGDGYLTKSSKYADEYGVGDIERISDGFALDGAWRPEMETKAKLADNAWIGIGKGVVLAAVGLPFLTMGPWIGIPCSIAACFAADWAYDKVVGHSQKQNPLAIAEAMRDMRDQGKPVAPEMMFALMLASLPPEDTLRRDMEKRLKENVGTHKFHKILENPQVASGLQLLMHDPKVVARLSKRHFALPEKDFMQHVTNLYNQGKIHTRGAMNPESQEVFLAIADEQLLAANAAPVSPPAGLPLGMSSKSSQYSAAHISNPRT